MTYTKLYIMLLAQHFHNYHWRSKAWGLINLLRKQLEERSTHKIHMLLKLIIFIHYFLNALFNNSNLHHDKQLFHWLKYITVLHEY